MTSVSATLPSVHQHKTAGPSNLAIFNEAENLSKTNTDASIKKYVEFLTQTLNNTDNETIKLKEIAITKAGEMLALSLNVFELEKFIRGLEEVWKSVPRAKAAKLIRFLMDRFEIPLSQLPKSSSEQRSAIKKLEMQLCKDLVEWSIRDKRTYLKQTLEQRLASLYLDNRLYTESLTLVGQLLMDLKRMDDKITLVEVHLTECRIYFQLRNGPKAKAALTAARSNANAVYCPPLIQAALDMQSALVYADESDFKTAYSYFIEALDGYSGQNDPRGAQALKYMLLCKIMMGGHHLEDLESLVKGKLGSRYALGSDVTAMQAIASAHRQRSLKEFETALSSYPEELGTDPLIHAHFQSLYDSLLCQNLLRIVKPYSRVQLSYIAQQIELPLHVVEGKLSLMILDGQLRAIIDQGDQCLVLEEEITRSHDKSFEYALETIKQFNSAVDALFMKATSV